MISPESTQDIANADAIVVFNDGTQVPYSQNDDKKAYKTSKKEQRKILLKESQKTIKKKIEKLFNSSKATVSKENIGQVSQTLIDLAKQKGIDLSNYSHAIDNSAINHTLKEHGNQTREEKRNQNAITEKDFEQIPNVIYNPDYVILGATERQKDIIAYAKNMEDGSIIVVEEVRKNKELMLKSIRKYRDGVNSSTLTEQVSHAPSDTVNIIILNENKENQDTDVKTFLQETVKEAKKTNAEQVLEQTKQAQQLLDDGATPEQVEELTGWSQDEKGWHFNVNDDDVTVNTLTNVAKNKTSGQLTLGDLISYPKLFRAYPFLANLPVDFAGGYNRFFIGMQLDRSQLEDGTLKRDICRMLHNYVLNEGRVEELKAMGNSGVDLPQLGYAPALEINEEELAQKGASEKKITAIKAINDMTPLMPQRNSFALYQIDINTLPKTS